MSKRKYTECDSSLFEQLPNELLIKIFHYLNGIDTIYAFSQLNTRFQCLIYNNVKLIDFKSVSKAKFDLVVKQHDVHRWQSLCLSDDVETPGQITYFRKLFSSSKCISQLQSLSMLNMKIEDSQLFLFQSFSFNYLVSLSIGNICGKNLPSTDFPLLKRLVIVSCKCITWMTNLHYLEYTIDYQCHSYRTLALPTTLKQLKLFYNEQNDGYDLRVSLRQMPQLTKLSLCDDTNHSLRPNGQKWEELIRSSLPLLKTFQFYFTFDYYTRALNDINEIIASFSTPFYLLEKRWLIRCHSDNTHKLQGVLYSIPFAFSRLLINVPSLGSDMPIVAHSNLYSKMKTLMLHEKCSVPNLNVFKPNIEKLYIRYNFTKDWFPLLINLRHLEIGPCVELSSTEFTCLFTNIPRLQSLAIPNAQLFLLTSYLKDVPLCEQLSQRIHSLNTAPSRLNEYTLDIVNVHMLSSIARVFGTRCEHLSLALIADPATIYPIIQRMQQLRSLKIKCNRSRYKPKDFARCWLENSLTDTQSDYVHNIDNNDFHLWFGNRP